MFLLCFKQPDRTVLCELVQRSLVRLAGDAFLLLDRRSSDGLASGKCPLISVHGVGEVETASMQEVMTRSEFVRSALRNPPRFVLAEAGAISLASPSPLRGEAGTVI